MNLIVRPPFVPVLPSFYHPLKTSLVPYRGVGVSTLARTTTKTITDNEGVLRTLKSGEAGFIGARRKDNLLSSSEDFNNAIWVVSSANSYDRVYDLNVAPPSEINNGFTKVTFARPQANLGNKQMYSNTFQYSKDLIFSIYVKKRDYDYFLISLENTGFSVYKDITVNLTNGTLDSSTGSPQYSIQDKGNGWYRISIRNQSLSSGNVVCNTFVLNNSKQKTYTGDGVSGTYICGAMLEDVTGQSIQTVGEYVSNGTIRRNLLVRSEEFDNVSWSKVRSNVLSNILTYSEDYSNAIWSKTRARIQSNLLTYSQDYTNAIWTKVTANVTINANTVTAPDGTLTGSTINRTGSGDDRINEAFSTVDNGQVMTYTIYAKKSVGSSCRADLRFTGGTTGLNYAYGFNFDTLAISSYADVASSVTFTPDVNGWFRIKITAANNATGNTAANVSFYANPNGGTYSTYIWGAQLEYGSSESTYTATTSASLPISFTSFDPSYVAQKLIDDNTSGSITHSIAYTRSGSNEIVNFSVYAKAAERSQINLQLSNTASANIQAYFDLSSGTVLSQPTNNADYTNSSATIENIGNGWYRCSISAFKQAVNTTNWGAVLLSNGGTIFYSGDGKSGVYVAGAQMTNGYGKFTYQKTTSTSLPILFTDYEGKKTARKLIEDTTASTTHFLREDLTISAGITYTKSIYFKAAERNNIQINFDTDGVAQFGANPPAVMFTATGSGVATILSAGTPINYGITLIADGWYRAFVTALCSVSGNFVNRYYLGSSGSATYTGDGLSGVYVSGSQIEVNSMPTTYQKITDASAIDFNNYHGTGVDGTKCFDTDLLGNKIPESTLDGVSIEPASTNTFIYSEDFTNAGWGKNNVSVTANATIAPNGTLTADKVYSPVTGSVSHYLTQAVNVNTSSTWTTSIYAKAAEYNSIGFQFGGAGQTNQENAQFILTGSGSVVLGSPAPVQASIEYIKDGWYRCNMSGTWEVTPGTVIIFVGNNGNNTYVGDGVSGVYLWGGQLENLPFASSYIPTTTASVTRNADDISHPNAGNVSDAQGTVLMDVTPAFDIPNGITAGYGYNFLIDFGISNGQIYARNNILSRADGTLATSTPAWVPLKGITYKIGSRYGSVGQRNFLNGIIGTNVAFDGSINSATNMSIGKYGGASSHYWGGGMKNLRIYTKVLSDAKIQTLTTIDDGLFFNKSKNSQYIPIIL